MYHKIRFITILASLSLVLATCSPMVQGTDEVPPGKEGMAAIDQPFQLQFDEAMLLPDQNIWVRFAAVKSDNRCPKDVQCVQAGEARIVLSISVNEGNAILLELSTVLDQATVVVEGYRILLQAVEPYPQSSGLPTPEKDYVITIVISRQ